MEKIKGFSIELSLDHLKVDSGLKDLKSSMRLMNSEMRNNMSVFDRGERSLQKYGVQLSGLNKKLEVQKTVTESARKHYEKMVAEHGEGSTQAQKAAAAYNHESAQLNNLERHIGKVTKEMQAFKREQEIQSTTLWKTGDALQNFGNHLDNISSKAREVGGNLTRYLTAPIVGVVATVGGMGFKRAMDIEQVDMMIDHVSDSKKEAETRMNDIVDLVTDTRFGTAEVGEQYAKFINASAKDTSANIYSQVAMNLSAFKQDDQLIPQIGDLFTKSLQSGKIDGMMINQFTNAGVDILKVLGNKWGMTTEETRERLRSGSIDIHEVLDELSEGILEGTEGELGVTKAMGGMLERSGDTLSGQVKNFFAAISQTGERLIKDTGLFDGVKNGLDEVRNMLKSGELDTVLLPTFSGISKALEALVDISRKVFKWFSNLSDSAKGWIGRLVGFAVVLGPIITGFGIFGGILAKVSKGLGTFLKFLAPILTPLKTVGTAAGGAGKSVGLLSRVFTFLTGPIGIAIGVISLLVAGFTTAYKRSETFRNFIHDLGEKLKEVFFGIVDWMRPGLDAVTNFFGSMKKKITGFKNEEGAQLIQAFQNIGSFIGVVAKGIWTGIKWTFEQIKWIIADYVMPVVEFVVKMVWGNIKGVITGALDVIMGAIKIFSGLFTGDWSKMWEGTKQLVVGAVKAVWNYINLLFIGRILKGIGVLVKSFGGLIGRMWTGTKTTFLNGITAVWNWMKNSFVGRIISSIINFVKNFRTNISSLWTRVKDLFKQRIIEVYNNFSNSFVGRIITGIINFAKNFRTNLSNMWQRVRTLFTDRITSIRNSIANSFVGRMLTSIRNLRTNFINIAKDMWSGVKKQFGNIVDGAKALPGRIGRGIKSMRSKATDGMKSVGNSIIRWAGKPFNKVVEGVNWVTGKLLPSRKEIPEWSIPQFAKGTGLGGHKGGDFIAGEKGRELVKLPDGRSFVTPDKATLFPDMPKGTHVIPNKSTEDILKSNLPHYADGTKGWFDSFKSSVGDVWDYVKNPGKIVSKLIDKIALKTGMAEIPKSIVSAGFNYVKDKPKEFLKNMFKENEDNNPNIAGAGKPAFGWPMTSPFGYRIHPISGARKLHGGVDFGAPSGTPVPSQTGGIVSFAGGGWNGGFGNLVKVKQGIWEMFYAHLSKILVSAGQSVTKGQILGNVGSTGASTGPHLHYETRKNGVRVNPMNKFATGGIIKSKMLAMLGEEGEEIVIPTARHRRTDAMKLLALAAKKIGADNGSFTRPSGIRGGGGGQSEEISLLKEQVELLTELVLSSRNIEKKPVLSEGDIKRSYDKLDGKKSVNHAIFTGRVGGN